MRRLLGVIGVVGLVALVSGLAASGVRYATRQDGDGAARPTAAADPGGLVVVAVFDQVRADALQRYAPLFGPGGFERMKRDGVWYANASLPCGATSTGPGHANIATGVTPDRHGIVENSWYDRGRGAPVFSIDRGPGPGRLLAPTVADALPPGAKAVSLALKSRAAILMGGKAPAACYWFETAAKEFGTAPGYRDSPHPWADAFRRSEVVRQWGGTAWDRAGPAADYDRLAGPDAAAGEAQTLGRTTFPYTLPAADAANYGAALEATPFGNDLLWLFAKAAIGGEQLGTRPGARDVLYLGFSATDVIGHAHGPDSHETADAIARADKIVADMVTHLDATVGDGRWTLIVTSDHGVCPLPERAVKEHPNAGRFHPGEIFDGLAPRLDESFGKVDGTAGKWVERVEWPWVYLNHKLANAEGVPHATLEAAAAEWLRNRPQVTAAYTRTELAGPALTDPDARRAQRAFHRDRSGDVCVVETPYTLPLGKLSVGTSHGSTHAYDRAVPVLASGRGVPASGRRDATTDALIVAPLVANLLSVPAPAGAATLPAELHSAPSEPRP